MAAVIWSSVIVESAGSGPVRYDCSESDIVKWKTEEEGMELWKCLIEQWKG